MSTVACPDCERKISEPGAECPRCGATAPDVASTRSRDPVESRGYCPDAIAALLLAIAALLVWPLAILAVVYGLAALRTIREQEANGRPQSKGQAMAVFAVAFSAVAIPVVIYAVVFV